MLFNYPRALLVVLSLAIANVCTQTLMLQHAAAQSTPAASVSMLEATLPHTQQSEANGSQELRQELWLRDGYQSPAGNLPTIGSKLNDPSSPISLAGCDMALLNGCDSSGCDSRSCRCSCYPCQCPLPEAPCIDCPRVTTLNPNFNIRMFGAFKLDMVFNQARPLAAGTPFFLLPDSLNGLSQETVDIHARQSTLGAAMTGPQFGGFQSGGTVVTLFFNDAIVVDQYGVLPLQAFGELKNDDWRFAAGLMFDVFNPGIPTVLPFSALSGSGNAGNSFRGQVRVERFIRPANNVQWTLQAALSEPITTTISPAFGISEDNGWPNVEGRIALGLGPLQGLQRPFEFGVSGLVGQVRTTQLNANDLVINRVVADVWGLGADFRWRMNDRFGVMGEFYTGQTLGTYNGAVLQTVNQTTREAIRSTGGWGEVFVYWTPCLHSHIGYGIDDPIDRDIDATPLSLGQIRNSTFYTNTLWDVNSTFRVAFEFTYRETDYAAPVIPDNEGAGFHTQFQWSF